MVSASSCINKTAPSKSLLRYLRLQFDNPSLFHPSSTRSPRCRADLKRSAISSAPWLSRSYSCQRRSLPFNPALTKPPTLPLSPFSCRASTSPQSSPGQIRSFSITSKKTRHSLLRLLGFGRTKAAAELKPDDLPARSAAVDDGLESNPFYVGRNIALKTSNEPRLRCTEFDENGNVTLVNGELKKSELIARYGLLPRDLRKIDSSVLPHILVRHSAILISLLHLRVLIKANRVLVFDAYGSADTYTQSLFMYDLEGKLRQKEPTSRQASASGALPYEFRALEAVLVSITSGLEAEFEGVREPVVRVLRALEEDVDRDKLRHLLIYSKRLGTFEQKARLVRDAIEDILEADDDLTAMYLTERGGSVYREEHDHQEVEMLLESYHKVCDEIVQASGNLITSIRNTEEVIRAILDANRNSLMLLDLKFSIGTLGLAAGTLCSALYGMNLKNFIEESDIGFGAVSGICFTLTAIVCAYGLVKLRKVQRVRMWGEGGLQDGYTAALGGRPCPTGLSRGNWRSDSLNPVWTALPGEARAQRMRRIRSGAPAASPSASPNAGPVSGASKRAGGGRSGFERDKKIQRPVSSQTPSKGGSASSSSTTRDGSNTPADPKGAELDNGNTTFNPAR